MWGEQINSFATSRSYNLKYKWKSSDYMFDIGYHLRLLEPWSRLRNIRERSSVILKIERLPKWLGHTFILVASLSGHGGVSPDEGAAVYAWFSSFGRVLSQDKRVAGASCVLDDRCWSRSPGRPISFHTTVSREERFSLKVERSVTRIATGPPILEGG